MCVGVVVVMTCNGNTTHHRQDCQEDGRWRSIIIRVGRNRIVADVLHAFRCMCILLIFSKYERRIF